VTIAPPKRLSSAIASAKAKTVSTRTTNDKIPTTPTHAVATNLKIGLFFAAPNTVDLLARIST
jgi:hypothetical protein